MIKPHTSHKQYTTKYCLQILEEKNENGTGRIPDPSDFSEGVWSRETKNSYASLHFHLSLPILNIPLED